jgi:Fur family ferric uptake transcriptional regulator
VPDFTELLREHGVPVTAQRLAVLRAVSRRPHVTADALAEEVRAEIGTISRQAVYDCVGILTEKGLINPLFPALRSSPTAVSRPPVKSKFLAVRW